ncbi:hypothetical protein A7982_13088 [Minicystis rosea]|nr:hypothetical protein A7982_13088 [Minicystis rosea]
MNAFPKDLRSRLGVWGRVRPIVIGMKARYRSRAQDGCFGRIEM